MQSTSRKWKKKKKLSLQTKSQRLEVYKKYTVTEAIREADLLIPLTVEERLEAACQFKESNFRQPRNLETKGKISKPLLSSGHYLCNRIGEIVGMTTNRSELETFQFKNHYSTD